MLSLVVLDVLFVPLLATYTKPKSSVALTSCVQILSDRRHAIYIGKRRDDPTVLELRLLDTWDLLEVSVARCTIDDLHLDTIDVLTVPNDDNAIWIVGISDYQASDNVRMFRVDSTFKIIERKPIAKLDQTRAVRFIPPCQSMLFLHLLPLFMSQ
jgi:hypothetical protein